MTAVSVFCFGLPQISSLAVVTSGYRHIRKLKQPHCKRSKTRLSKLGHSFFLSCLVAKHYPVLSRKVHASVNVRCVNSGLLWRTHWLRCISGHWFMVRSEQSTFGWAVTAMFYYCEIPQVLLRVSRKISLVGSMVMKQLVCMLRQSSASRIRTATRLLIFMHWAVCCSDWPLADFQSMGSPLRS